MMKAIRNIPGTLLGLFVSFLTWGLWGNYVIAMALGIVLGGIWDVLSEEDEKDESGEDK